MTLQLFILGLSLLTVSCQPGSEPAASKTPGGAATSTPAAVASATPTPTAGATILQFKDVGEIVEAQYSVEVSSGANFRVQASSIPLGRFASEGWASDFDKVGKMVNQDGLMFLTTARPAKVPPGTITLKSKDGKTFTYTVPGITGDIKAKKWVLDDGTELPEGRLYMGADGKLYLDESGQKLVKTP